MKQAKVPGVAQVTHRYCPPFTRAWSKITILAELPGVARGILKIQNKFGQFHPPGYPWVP